MNVIFYLLETQLQLKGKSGFQANISAARTFSLNDRLQYPLIRNKSADSRTDDIRRNIEPVIIGITVIEFYSSKK